MVSIVDPLFNQKLIKSVFEIYLIYLFNTRLKEIITARLLVLLSLALGDSLLSIDLKYKVTTGFPS